MCANHLRADELSFVIYVVALTDRSENFRKKLEMAKKLEIFPKEQDIFFLNLFGRLRMLIKYFAAIN